MYKRVQREQLTVRRVWAQNGKTNIMVQDYEGCIVGDGKAKVGGDAGVLEFVERVGAAIAGCGTLERRSNDSSIGNDADDISIAREAVACK